MSPSGGSGTRARSVHRQERHGHNRPPVQEHLHSHPHDGAPASADGKQRDDDSLLANALMEGFDTAEDKASFLRMAGIPLHIEQNKGERLHLVDVELRYAYQVATASPGFGGAALNYMPFPASMIRERATMHFVYVSMQSRRDIDLTGMVELLKERSPEERY